MSVIAEFSLDASDFALHDALAAAPDLVVEIERVVATTEDKIMPYFWVSGGDPQEFEAAFDADESVADATVVDTVDGARLYRAAWTKNVETIVYAYMEIGATILRATGNSDQWHLQMRFDSREKISEFRAYCDDYDIAFELDRIHEQEQPMASGQYGLTPTQRDTLVAALEKGYYDVPQQATMAELAAELDVSQQAVSKRFHNGYANLIESTLLVSSPEDE